MTVPPDIDSVNHVGMAVRDLAATVGRYEAMGFQLTPYSPHSGAWKPGEAVHPMRSGNRCVMFRHNYLEILSSENPAAPAPRLANYLRHHEGAHIICFNTGDVAGVDRRLVAAGLKTSGLMPLQREIETPDGVRTARFERVGFAPDDSPEGFIQAARHFTPEYIYQPRYIRHPNGCTELSDVIVVADDLDHFAGKYARYLGRAPERTGGVVRFRFPLVSTLTLVDVQGAKALLPGSLMPPIPGIAAVAFRAPDLPALRARLSGHGFAVGEAGGGRRVVPAEQASGLAIVFEAG